VAKLEQDHVKRMIEKTRKLQEEEALKELKKKGGTGGSGKGQSGKDTPNSTMSHSHSAKGDGLKGLQGSKGKGKGKGGLSPMDKHSPEQQLLNAHQEIVGILMDEKKGRMRFGNCFDRLYADHFRQIDNRRAGQLGRRLQDEKELRVSYLISFFFILFQTIVILIALSNVLTFWAFQHNIIMR
jgi:hypothetical protein